MAELPLAWLAFAALGAFSGFFAGLLGVGGGAVLVPLLAMVFTALQLPVAHVMHLALGTSMAVIVFTSISSLSAHHRHGAVKWSVVRGMTPGVVIGTLMGAQLASRLATRPLALFFAAFMTLVALQMAFNLRPKAARRLPGARGMLLVGFGIGGISSLVAIGGGSMSVPFMTWCNLKMQHAIGTSAAVGLPLALSGAVGYVIGGYHAAGLPAGSLGFVYLPALVATVVASVVTAPLGARLAHRLPVSVLKRTFSLVLLLLSLRMVLSLL